MVLRYYLGDLQEAYLDFNRIAQWTTDHRTAMRQSFNHYRRQTFSRDEIVCECGLVCSLWDNGKTTTRELPGKDPEVFYILLAVCEPCLDSGGDGFPWPHHFEEVIG